MYLTPEWICHRFRFNIMILTQDFLLAPYPAECKDELRWYAMVCSYAPAFILWLFHKAFLRRLVYVWICVLRIGTQHCHCTWFCRRQPRQKQVLGSRNLKDCPLHYTDHSTAFGKQRKGFKWKQRNCLQVVFSNVDMIDIVLDQKEHGYGISKDGKSMIVVACLSLLLWPWQMAEHNIEKGRRRNLTAILRNIFEMTGVNLAFLIIHLVIAFKYNKDESIFVAKNVITIILSMKEIFNLHTSLRTPAASE